MQALNFQPDMKDPSKAAFVGIEGFLNEKYENESWEVLIYVERAK